MSQQSVLTDEELNLLMNRMGKPILKFIIKIIEREMLSGYYKEMNLNTFISIVSALLANTNRNVIDWVSMFYKDTTKQDAPYDHIKKHFLKDLDDSFNLKIGKN